MIASVWRQPLFEAGARFKYFQAATLRNQQIATNKGGEMSWKFGVIVRVKVRES